MIRFIHASDLHLDSPLRGLARYEGAPVERLRRATRDALARLVDRALDEAIDFVLLAGDIYDGDWPDFRTGLYFREQLARLARAGIPVFIVHGNHDAQGVISRRLVLPDNVSVFSSRAAETVRLDRLGVAIHGRSFPDRAVDEDLVPGYPPALPGFFNIGLLHTSLSGRAGHDTYAPTDVATLTARGYDYWALGHVHAREVVCEAPRIVFPGNLQGRHANETGAKGCELVTVDGGAIDAEFVPLDVVRWAQVTLALDGVDSLPALGDALRARFRATIAGAGDRLHAVRVTLTGRSALHALEAAAPGTLAAAAQAAAQDLADGELWIEQVRPALSSPPAHVATDDDALGELARLVEALAGDEAALAAWSGQTIGELVAGLPAEIVAEMLPAPEDGAGLRQLLHDAEATVLARIAGIGVPE